MSTRIKNPGKNGGRRSIRVRDRDEGCGRRMESEGAWRRERDRGRMATWEEYEGET